MLGRWWADIPKNEWPEGSEGEITVDFDGKFGDRRQELVFIGQVRSYTPLSSRRKGREEKIAALYGLHNPVDLH